jgi:Flp pilus assembly protein TadD
MTLCAACGSARPAPSAPETPAARTRAAVAEAETHERARRHDLARAAYRRAITEAPDPLSEAYARREHASALAFWGEVPAAITELEIVVRLAPGAAPAWHDLGILRHSVGDDAGAAVALRTARALRPADPRPRIALAALLWHAGDRAGAAAEYRALLELDLPPRVRDRVEWALGQLTR